MNTKHPQGGSWPTPEQELLLRAALLQGEDAIDAWREWKAKVDVDRLDKGSYRLLPLLYQSLRTHGVKDPSIDRFKGVYRKTWYHNRIVFRGIATLLDSFHDAGIQTLILKGAALTLLHYKDFGLRPMNDFDVLVPTEKATATVNLLTELGWKSQLSRRPEAFTERFFSVIHSHGFEDAASRCQFDLHWHALLECCYANADNDFWDAAVPTKVYDVSTRALNPTDQLLHACVHGARWNPTPPLRWVADAMTIMNTSQSEIDWQRLITQAQKRHLSLPLRGTLNYLRNLLSAPIPSAVLQSLESIPVSRSERTEYSFRTNPPGRIRRLRRMRMYWYRYLRCSQLIGDTSLQHKLIGFPKFLQRRWEIDHPWQVPFYVASRGMRRIRKSSVTSLPADL